jgi:p-aminobenzoyl-glutamate transporter AbgT
MFHQYFAIFFMKMLTNIFSKCSNIFQKKFNILFFASTSSGPVAGHAQAAAREGGGSPALRAVARGAWFSRR